MADPTGSAILSKGKVETGSGFEVRPSAVSVGPLTTGVINDFQTPRAPETPVDSQNPWAVIQEAIANQSSRGTPSLETLFSEATGKPLQK